MPIPNFQEIMTPFLKVFEKEKKDVLNMRDVIDLLGKHFNLTEEEKKKLLPSGNDIIFDNRVRFARLYLMKAGLIESKERGFVNITFLGKNELKINKNQINLKYLEKFSSYNDFKLQLKDKKNNKEKSINEISEISQSDVSPIDLLENGFFQINESLKDELKNKLKEVNPYYFEKIILKLLNKMGYGDFYETSKSGDGGIDGIINMDELGVDRIYIQCKRYIDNKVREPEIRNFIGAMSNEVSKGIFVTTSDFDEKAKEKAKLALNKIVLINGDKLLDLMIKFNIGVQDKNIYITKELDNDFFIE